MPLGPWVSFRSHSHVLLWALPSPSSLPRSRWGLAARGTLPLRNLRGLQLHGPVPGVRGRLSLPSESGLDQELCQRHQGVRGRSVSRTHLASTNGSLHARVGQTPSRGSALTAQVPEHHKPSGQDSCQAPWAITLCPPAPRSPQSFKFTITFATLSL